ncbi:MAG: rod shape-determining protein MreC [Clostridia bacterium]|nr:rod shape-determining protein MreC [Clostridia bacterium]
MRNNSTQLKIAAVIIVLVAVIVSFVKIGSSYNPVSTVIGTVLTPIQSFVNSASDSVKGFFSYFYEFDSLKAENEQLKDRIAELEKLESKYNKAISENQYLRVLARLSIENPTYEYEFASVTAIETGDYHKIVTIDKGQAHGIELYDCAIVREGLVGYVSKVGPNFAEITTVLDPSMKIGALISRTQEIGVAEGMAEYIHENKLKLSYLDNETTAKYNDVVETSGYGDIYPKGLVIGYVDEVVPESHGLSTYATVRPAVELSQLKKLYIIKEFSE